MPDLSESAVATHLCLEDHLARLIEQRRGAPAGNATARASAQAALAALIGLAALAANGILLDLKRFVAAPAELPRSAGDLG